MLMVGSVSTPPVAAGEVQPVGDSLATIFPDIGRSIVTGIERTLLDAGRSRRFSVGPF